MAIVNINTNRTAEAQDLNRAIRYKNLAPEEKFNELLALIKLNILLNKGQPTKMPQGKGLVLRKLK